MHTSWWCFYVSFVHRLVARAFLGPPPSLEQMQVHHRDADPSNNHVDNLEYVTASQNIQYSYVSSPGWQRSSVGRCKPILACVDGSSEWERFPSISEAARELKLGRSMSNISQCARGCRNRVGKYKFRFAEPEHPPIFPGEVWQETTALDE